MKKLFLALAFLALANFAQAQTYYHQLSNGPSATDYNSGTQGNAAGGGALLYVSPPQSGPVGTLFNNSIPFIYTSSATMGNNGAITAITTLPTTYASAYIYVPAGAIATSSTAGWYYGTCSSATACTITNNVYTSGAPTIPASPTAFATTGPGAFTQTTGSNIVGPTYSLPGGYLGPNHCFETRYLASTGAGNTNNKIVTIIYNTTTVATFTNASATLLYEKQAARTCDRGVVAKQVTDQGLVNPGSVVPVWSSVDDSAAQNITFNFQLATATDFIVMEQESVQFVP